MQDPNPRGGVDVELAQQATSKVPPFWSPDLELRGYPFSIWIKDLGLWVAGTELAAERIAPIIAQRLGGAARNLVRELDPTLLAQGRIDEQTGVQLQTGVQVLITGLCRRFGSLGVESSTKAIIGLISFKRGNAHIDEALSRFETIRNQVQHHGDGFEMPVQATACMLIESMNIPRAVWPLLFHPFNGDFPANEPQLTQLMAQIRQQGHIAEHTHAGPRGLRDGFGANGRGNYYQDAYLGTEGGASSGSGWPDLSSSSGWPATSDGYYGDQDAVVFGDEGFPCCAQCESYLYDDELNGDDSETDDDQEWFFAQSAEDQAAYLGTFEHATYESLLEAYLLHKRRFRHFAKRARRHERYPRKPWSFS